MATPAYVVIIVLAIVWAICCFAVLRFFIGRDRRPASTTAKTVVHRGAEGLPACPVEGHGYVYIWRGIGGRCASCEGWWTRDEHGGMWFEAVGPIGKHERWHSARLATWTTSADVVNVVHFGLRYAALIEQLSEAQSEQERDDLRKAITSLR